MGTCFSTCSPPTTLPDPPHSHPKTLTLDTIPRTDSLRKKSVFVIKHRSSHEADPETPQLGLHVTAPPEQDGARALHGAKKRSFDFDNNQTLGGGKGKGIDNGGDCEGDLVEGSDDVSLEEGRGRHSASRAMKRSFDFDNQTLFSDKGKEIDNGGSYEGDLLDGGGDEVSLADRISRHRRSRSLSSAGRRRSPRVSRSPSGRSDSPVSGTTSASSNIGASNNNVCTNRPGKMVSVPATVSNVRVGGEHRVERISVRRNVGDSSMVGRSGLSPRARSPAKRALSLSRSSSKRAEYSPYRRDALGDIDQNCSGNDAQVPYQKINGENRKSNRVLTQGTYSGSLRSIATDEYQMDNDGEGSQPMTGNMAFRTQGSRVENHKQQGIANKQQDLDLDADVQLNHAPSSYTALLLEDIQNFHQKNAPAISLPPCVSKAQSIVDAVADLNSGTRSNFYAALSDQMRKNSTPVPFNGANDKYISPVSGDLADSSFHKYVTVKRGTVDVDEDEEESSGSNSFVSGNQHWVSSSSWEPNSSDSTGNCTSSRSNVREDTKISMSSQGHTHSFSESDQQRSGIGRYRVGSGRI